MTSYRELAARLTSGGLLTPGAARAACERLAGEGLLDTDLAPHHIPSGMTDLGAAVEVHTDDVDDLAGAYRAILADAAALSGGDVTVAEVRLLHEPGGEELRLTINGHPVAWRVEHMGPEHLDTLAIAENINELAPSDDDRRFYQWDGDDHGALYFVLARPDQIAALHDSLGLAFVSME